jgi:hypothetical protein
MIFSSVAMAADGTAPGHPLYAFDRVLETIAIGDGGIAERLDEFDALIEAGSTEKAVDLLADVMRTANPQDASVVRGHAQAETATPNQGADAPHAKVDEIHDSTNAHRDNGTADDGPESGQDVYDPTPVNASQESGGPGNGQANGNGSDQGNGHGNGQANGHGNGEGNGQGNSPAQGQGSAQQTEEPGTGVADEPSGVASSPTNSARQGQPAHAGPKEEHTPGPPEHAGPKADKDAPENAGPKEKP